MRASLLFFSVSTTLILGACADVNRGLTDLNKGLADANNSLLSSRTLATPLPDTQEARISVPNDRRTSEAFEAALPSIQRVVSIHKCIKHCDGMRLLNKEAVPGVGMPVCWNNNFPNHIHHMEYHNAHSCVSVRAIDNISMPAKNAMQMRIVYFAEDSGETVNFGMLFKKLESGRWMLGAVPEQIN